MQTTTDIPLATPRMARRFAACVLAVGLAGAIFAGTAGATTVYDNIASPLPGNLPSEGFQTTQSAEFGGQVGLAGTQRIAQWVEVVMDSFGCEQGTYTAGCSTTPGATFTEPVTLNLYNVGPGNSVGTKIAAITQTFAVPFRPSANAMCATPSQWLDAADGNCYNGIAEPITFDLTGRDITLPSNVIASISLNTSDYGYAPYGHATACYTSPEGCGYDALNVGLSRGSSPTVPSVGSDPDTNDNYLYSIDSYCDHGAAGVNVFRLDAPAVGGTPCWSGLAPAMEIDATVASSAVGVTVTANMPSALQISTSGAPPSLGNFVAGVAASYTSTLAVSATSTGATSQLTAYDPSPANTGHLVNGAYVLVQPLQADATDSAHPTGVFAPIGSVMSPELLLNETGPYSGDAITLNFLQAIGASDPLRTGSYAVSIVLTLTSSSP